MANKRLLTDKEIDTFNNYGDSWISEDDWNIKELLQAQNKKTLQEVGKWLDKELSDPHNEIEAVTKRKVSKRGGRFYTEDIESLKRGEMPR